MRTARGQTGSGRRSRRGFRGSPPPGIRLLPCGVRGVGAGIKLLRGGARAHVHRFILSPGFFARAAVLGTTMMMPVVRRVMTLMLGEATRRVAVKLVSRERGLSECRQGDGEDACTHTNAPFLDYAPAGPLCVGGIGPRSGETVRRTGSYRDGGNRDAADAIASTLERPTRAIDAWSGRSKELAQPYRISIIAAAVISAAITASMTTRCSGLLSMWRSIAKRVPSGNSAHAAGRALARARLAYILMHRTRIDRGVWSHRTLRGWMRPHACSRRRRSSYSD